MTKFLDRQSKPRIPVLSVIAVAIVFGSATNVLAGGSSELIDGYFDYQNRKDDYKSKYDYAPNNDAKNWMRASEGVDALIKAFDGDDDDVRVEKARNKLLELNASIRLTRDAVYCDEQLVEILDAFIDELAYITKLANEDWEKKSPKRWGKKNEPGRLNIYRNRKKETKERLGRIQDPISDAYVVCSIESGFEYEDEKVGKIKKRLKKLRKKADWVVKKTDGGLNTEAREKRNKIETLLHLVKQTEDSIKLKVWANYSRETGAWYAEFKEVDRWLIDTELSVKGK